MFTFPEWLQDYQIKDEEFAGAYEMISPQQRAWLKKTIAQVYAVNSPENPQKTWTVNTWRGGFETEVSGSPLDWVVMLIDKGSVSAVRILAALTPALACGVKNVLVAFTGDGEISPAVLTGFELAGQEDVVCVSSDRLSELLSYVAGSGFNGTVLDMRSVAERLPYSAQMRYWRGPKISIISVCKDENLPDMDVLAFAHPDVDFVCVEEESLEDAPGQAIVVPAELVGDVLSKFRIVLAHGQEGCWIWNDFDSSFFRQESVALAVAE
ncbi:histidinol dehydrogenase [Maridesulfovibrio hydrothermalis]|uniref:Uncharacterized protein n=1 Tax=Maridesulfovibrio hydrothermalis AM13 = DSM 14728 TaxID=1121451 RepID=L0RDW3_9BACT|nr:histidinol dehydrogenase [Maridesulfovibrio hydrothermalis]CCO24397.1 conserved protein of unknown function [Maridesulfovibrio hydrothermalis AM13 = DSM 14728]